MAKIAILLASLLVFYAAGRSGFWQGPLKIKVDGAMIDLNVAALDPLLVTSKESGTAITMTWGGETRAFVVKDALDDMPVENYYNFSLLNKELSYDIDVSTVGCSCNAALFFTSMPGYSPNGSIAHGNSPNPYYCDASDVGGVWCWEHDTMEANMYTMATTPHRCSGPAGTYIPACDNVGCSTNAYSIDPNGMCPDARCKIDSRRPFRIVQRFEVDPVSMNLSRITNSLVQGDSVFKWEVCSEAWYLALMTSALARVKMVFQLWGDTHKRMIWLDNMTSCNGDCNSNNATVTFSNIEISSIKPDDSAYVL